MFSRRSSRFEHGFATHFKSRWQAKGSCPPGRVPCQVPWQATFCRKAFSTGVLQLRESCPPCNCAHPPVPERAGGWRACNCVAKPFEHDRSLPTLRNQGKPGGPGGAAVPRRSQLPSQSQPSACEMEKPAAEASLPPDGQVGLQIIEEIRFNPAGRRRRPRARRTESPSLKPW